MKKLSIILACFLVALAACTKSNEVHPELGNGNDEIITVGVNDIHVKYFINNMDDVQKAVFYYGIAETQQITPVEMTKNEDCFELLVNDLLSDTIYNYYYELFPYVGNAYRTEQNIFHTQAGEIIPIPPTPPVEVPIGAINGLFTVNENGKQVYFSQGNLQYRAFLNIWRFAEKQWDYVGDNLYGTVYENGAKCDNLLISSTYDGWIDLFRWATSGYDHGAVCYQPWSYVGGWPNTNFNAYGYAGYNLYDQTGKADWGYNVIFNGGCEENQWRTLKIDEWDYIVNTRNTVSGIRYAKATITSDTAGFISGVVLLPDDWNESFYSLVETNTQSAEYSSNYITTSDWENLLESKGAVFLPASGNRWGIYGINYVGWWGGYWSSSVVVFSSGYETSAHAFTFIPEDLFAMDVDYREAGLSVRLVRDVNL